MGEIINWLLDKLNYLFSNLWWTIINFKTLWENNELGQLFVGILVLGVTSFVFYLVVSRIMDTSSAILSVLISIGLTLALAFVCYYLFNGKSLFSVQEAVNLVTNNITAEMPTINLN
jgi:hypothetical protein